MIVATNCYIEEVNLRLPKLEMLDLSNNFIRSFPILANMQKLKSLNLNSNKLVDLKQMNIDFTLGVTAFDLGNNQQLQFESTQDFDQFLNKIKKLKLEYFTIDAHCIKEHNGLMKIINQIKSIRQLNGDDKETIAKKIER